MLANCSHILNAHVSIPNSNSLIFKDECTCCFDTDKFPGGIDVCLTCYNGGCVSDERNHSMLHNVKSGHPLCLNIQKIRKENSYEERSSKALKLEIIETSKEQVDQENYETIFKLKCLECKDFSEISPLPDNVDKAINAIKSALSASKKSEVHSWTKEVIECQHLLSLHQDPSKFLTDNDRNVCSQCDKTENLWLCLECGSVGCGRRQYDGSGGNNHAIDHFNTTGHIASVKLGTIEPNGTADVYCYLCDENRLDSNLHLHLKMLGIDVESQIKTEKGLSELELEQNLKLDFSMVSDDGKNLIPLYGSGLTGLINLGNSCYLSSAVISLFNLKDFHDDYSVDANDHFLQCQKPSRASCLTCQLFKLYDGLFSGRYSLEPSKSSSENHTIGVAPRMFKDAISTGDPEFSTMRQQDSFEFFQFMSKNIRVSEKSNLPGQDSMKMFDFYLMEKLKCTICNGVKYKKQISNSITLPILENNPENSANDLSFNLYQSFNEFCKDELIDGYSCPKCKKPTPALKSFKFNTFPDVLVIQMRRFKLVNWVPTKIDTPVSIDNTKEIVLDHFRDMGPLPDEEVLPEDEASNNNQEQIIDSEILSSLVSAGFPEDWCKYAILSSGGNSADNAMNWLLENIDRLSEPAPPLSSIPKTNSLEINSFDPSSVEMLVGMGFNQNQSIHALSQTDGDVERAVDYLFSHPEESGNSNQNIPLVSGGILEIDSKPAVYELSSFISHKGKSVHSGHYVAHLYKDDLSVPDTKWVLFNDDRVVAQPNPPIETAYVYLLSRK
ncbi:Ubiquitin carboxyl-terminal hydrolase 14 [Smittium mucronatum]|uniref:Ubiquitin carboxyl-terminal hydrolase n=1 Tax=Smittium mucronatum TaxID=133383 RepID=A0A1R0GRY9_9FUNG|nr:Ubiquitin carboxyl-terminal hydrolase 14 [Smittium mucronatum]